jgi:hypothetical protein
MDAYNAKLLNPGTVSLHQSAINGMKQITVRPPMFGFALSEEALFKTNVPPQVIVTKVAQHLGKQVEKYITGQIIKAFTGHDMNTAIKKTMEWEQDQYAKANYDAFYVPLSWDDPKSNPLADIQAMKKHLMEHDATAYLKGTFDDPSVPQAGHPSIKVFEQLIPGFKKLIQTCPEKNCWKSDLLAEPLWTTIVHLNDQHKWSREEIADWLETLDHDLRLTPVEEVNTHGNDD